MGHARCGDDAKWYPAPMVTPVIVPMKQHSGKPARRKPSPFGRETRLAALDEYLSQCGAVTAENAWEHMYRLLLSIDRRTRLAHVYDGSHMQKGGNFHSRAVRFTELLCQHWGSNRIDFISRSTSCSASV